MAGLLWASIRLALILALTALACLAAALYGAGHNQISYTVGPSYFHDFKFHQFAIAEEWRGRIGAAQVGVLASWWMGLALSPPLLLIALRRCGPAEGARRFIKGAEITIAVALGVGLIALGGAALFIVEAPAWALRFEDPLGFARAGVMHDAAYLGGAVGLIVAAIVLIRRGPPIEER